MLSIKVLGPGCANCEKVEEIAKKVVATLSIDATVTKLTDRAVWQKYGLLSTRRTRYRESLLTQLCIR